MAFKEIRGPEKEFRSSIPTPEFEVAEKVERGMEQLRATMTRADEHYAGAGMFLSEMHRAETPNEVKPAILKEAFKEIQVGGGAYNDMLANDLVEEIRYETDPGLRTRHAVIVAHELQQSYLPDSKTADLGDLKNRIERIETFRKLAKNPEADPKVRAWAEMLVEPRGAFKDFIAEYDRDQNITMRPRIEEEVLEDLPPSAGPGAKLDNTEKRIENMKLRIAAVPNLDKLLAWIDRTGTYLPVVLQRQEGADWVAIEAPSNIASSLGEAVAYFRENKISRSQLLGFADKLVGNIIGRLNAEQRAEFNKAFASNSVELRFTTERVLSRPKKKAGATGQPGSGKPGAKSGQEISVHPI